MTLRRALGLLLLPLVDFLAVQVFRHRYGCACRLVDHLDAWRMGW